MNSRELNTRMEGMKEESGGINRSRSTDQFCSLTFSAQRGDPGPMRGGEKKKKEPVCVSVCVCVQEKQIIKIIPSKIPSRRRGLGADSVPAVPRC